MADEKLYNEVSRIVGTAILKNDRNYADDIIALISQREEALLERLKDKLPPNDTYYEGMQASEPIKDINISVRSVRELIDQELRNVRGER